MEKNKSIYLVSGCGISIIVEKGQDFKWFVDWVIDRGQVPICERYV